MLLTSTCCNKLIAINDCAYIKILPNMKYNLEVWQQPADNGYSHRIGRMDYKYHRDSFAGFIYRLFPQIDMIQIHNLQKQINPFFELEV